MFHKFEKLVNNDNFFSLLSNMVVALIYLLCMIILPRYLSTEEFGEFAIYFTGVIVVDLIRIGLLYTPLIKFISSSKTSKEMKTFIGSGWVLLFMTNTFVLMVFVLFNSFAYDLNLNKGFVLFFEWYPPYGLASLVYLYSMIVLQGLRKFKKLLVVRILCWAVFLGLIIMNILWLKKGLNRILFFHVLANAGASVFVLTTRWVKLTDVIHASKECMLKILNFGKYSIGTIISSMLLKSVDVFLIGIFLSNSEIAFYNVPMRMIESLDVPLQSFSMVALTLMSNLASGRYSKLNSIFYRYTFFTFLLFLPFLTVLFLFAKDFVGVFAGEKYIVNNVSRDILRIFILYGFFLITDRFTSIMLDSINMPKWNFAKVVFMNIMNIVGDIIALKYFYSLNGVAFVTLLNSVGGSVLGLLLLKRYTGINIRDAIRQIREDVRNGLHQLSFQLKLPLKNNRISS